MSNSGIEFTVEGMNCSRCVAAVEDSLRHVEGVKQVVVTLNNGKAHIEGDNLDSVVLKRAVKEVGYTVKE